LKVKYDTKEDIEEMTTEELEKMLKEMDEDYL
jgi:ribosomal protein L29